MRLEFVYSRNYFRNLTKHKGIGRNWDEIVCLGKAFEGQYAAKIDDIIKMIPQVVGKPWEKEIIEVYVVDWAGPSFSHPLTLKVREDLLLMLVILTHELLHQFYTKDFYSNEEENESKINQDVNEVFERLGLDVSKQMGDIPRLP